MFVETNMVCSGVISRSCMSSLFYSKPSELSDVPGYWEEELENVAPRQLCEESVTKSG